MEKLIRLKTKSEVLDWQSSSGALLKPENCKLCALGAVGKSFVPDFTPEKPLIAYILDMPTKDDAINNAPFSGAMGKNFQKLFIEDVGLKKENVLISHILRCVQPVDKYGKRSYPTSFLQRAGEFNCRFYDTALNALNPNVFILTLDPSTIYAVGCHVRQIQRDIRKGITFLHKGYVPCILFGEGSSSLFFPYLKNNGGIKNFRGHYWVGTLPFKNKEINEKVLSRKLFVEGT